MNKRNKIVCILLLTISLILIFLYSFQKADTVQITVTPSQTGYHITAQIPGSTTTNTVTAFCDAHEHYFLFLPSYAKDKRISINYPKELALDAEEGAALTSLQETEQHYLLNESKLTIMTGSQLPVIFITLNKDLSYVTDSQDNYSKGQICILNKDASVTYNGELDKLQGRGNNSWQIDKKSFNISLSDTITLFEGNQSDKYSLVASRDHSLLKNRISYEMANALQAPRVGRYSTELYINGDYQGVYELCEKITPETLGIHNLEEETENLNLQHGTLNQITTQEYKDDWNNSVTGKWWDYPNSPADLTGGYIFESDDVTRYGNETSGFTLNSGAYIVSKSPAYLTAEQYNFSLSYMQKLEEIMIESVEGDNYEALSEYMDIYSFVAKYLIEEVSKNVDCSTTSQYFFKDKNDVLYAGPAWDFDCAYGVIEWVVGDIDFEVPEGFSARNIPGTLNWWQLLYYNNAFYQDICDTYQNKLSPWLTELTQNTLEQWETEMADSAAMEYIRRNYSDSSDSAIVRQDYHNQVTAIADFIQRRQAFLYAEWINQ